MSTYYRPSEPIAISEIEEKCKDDFKVLYRYDDQNGQWFRDNDGNFLHFALNEDKEVIEKSPKILNFLDDESNFFFEAVLNNLKKLNI